VDDTGDTTVRVVAGCLFEVCLPAGPAPWRYEPSGHAVTLLGDAVRDGAHRFRFRAEAAGAEAGHADLLFRAGVASSTVVVGIAPEPDL
jgi:hypothetical protein